MNNMPVCLHVAYRHVSRITTCYTKSFSGFSQFIPDQDIYLPCIRKTAGSNLRKYQFIVKINLEAVQ